MGNRRSRGCNKNMSEDTIFSTCQHTGCNQYGRETKNAGCYCAMHRAEIQLRKTIESNWPECICHSTLHFGNRYPPPGGYYNIEPFIPTDAQCIDTIIKLFKAYRKLPVRNDAAFKEKVKLDVAQKTSCLNQQVKRFSRKFFEGDEYRNDIIHHNGKKLGYMSYERYHIGFCVACHGWDYSQEWHRFKLYS